MHLAQTTWEKETWGIRALESLIIETLVLTSGHCAPLGTSVAVWRQFWSSRLGVVLLASAGWRPEVLLTPPSAQDTLPQRIAEL